MKRITSPFGLLDLLIHGLEPLFELAAVLRPGHQRAEVERQKLLVLQAFGHVALNDPVCDTLGNRGLPHTGLTDQHRVVFGAARENLHDPAYFLVTADHRVGLPLTGRFGQIARVLLERLELSLWVRVGHALTTSDLLQGLEQCCAIDALGDERLLELSVAVASKQHVLCRRVLVFEGFGFFPRIVQKVAKA